MPENYPEDNYIIVIRSSDERTRNVCRNLIEQQASPDAITIIQLTPFKAALEECFRIGIQSKKKWLITADADMLFLPDTIKILVEQAEKMPENYIQLQGKIKDKITDNIRKGGPRIYRVSLLHKLLKLSLSIEDNIRPESFMINSFGERGYPSRYISYMTCLHDYEQYYKDLYRKAFVHAYKHPEFLPEIIRNAVKLQNEDLDYKVILKAIWDSLTEESQVAIDTRLYSERSRTALNEIKVEEKKDLAETYGAAELVKKELQKSSLHVSGSNIGYYDTPVNHDFSYKKIFRLIRERGAFKGIRFGLGILLKRIGNKLQA